MTDQGSTRSPEAISASPWRRFYEPLILVLLVGAIYGARLTTLPVRGEESRWGTCLMQMLETGDWVVPRQQGLPYIDRPPLALWAMAPVGMLRGEVDELTIRLPSVVAIVLTTLLIYAYGLTFLSRFGAFTAAVAYATMGQVLQIGRLGENEAVFALLLSGALLSWHYGYLRGRPGLAWNLGYALAALATLQKGIQAPAYFAAATGLYVLLLRDWRWLFSRWQVSGLAIYAAIVCAWFVPFWLATDSRTAMEVWLHTVAYRFQSGSLLEHLWSYPLETLACLLPWSVLLVALVRKSVRESLGQWPAQIIFLLTAVAATYPSVWLAVSAKGRYFLPLYPCLALVLGWIAQTCAMAAAGTVARGVWKRYLSGVAVVLLGAGAVLTAASFFSIEALAEIAQPRAFAVVYLVAAVAAAALLLWASRSSRSISPYVGVVSLAAMLGLSYAGAVMNAEAKVANDMTAHMAELREQLPPGARLVSFGPVNHRFAYYYGDLIAEEMWPTQAEQVDDEVVYFCYDFHQGDTPERRVNGRGLNWSETPGTLPFAWEPVAELAVDRNRMAEPEVKVIVGRRVRPALQVAEPQSVSPTHRE